MSDGTDVLRAIDQLRHDLSGYHGQLKAHNDLQRHCDNQRERIAELEGLYEKAKAERDEAAMSFSKERDRAEFLMRENAKLRELVRDAWGDGHPDRSCEGCDIRDECHNDVERMRKDGMLRFSRCLFELRIEERMRELGIEV